MTPGEWMVLAGHFMLLSPLAIGGGITVAPGVHRLLVARLGLLTDQQFMAAIAIGQVSPGPNVLYVAVAGYQAAGVGGAAAAMAGIMLPSSLLTLAASRWMGGRRDWRVVRAFQAGMAPVTIALLFATSWIVATENVRWSAAAVTIGAALLVWRTRVHLLWLMAAGALLGALGLL